MAVAERERIGHGWRRTLPWLAGLLLAVAVLAPVVLIGGLAVDLEGTAPPAPTPVTAAAVRTSPGG